MVDRQQFRTCPIFTLGRNADTIHTRSHSSMEGCCLDVPIPDSRGVSWERAYRST